MASIRTLMPRAGFSLHAKQLQQRWHLPTTRYISTKPPPPPKPRVLEKPDKFRPPSHPARLRSKPRYTYGPELTQQQKTRRYPHMMPPEGSFMHWFLTNRYIHLFITLGILLSLVFGVWLTDFLHKTPYLDLLPPNSMFFAHPFAFLGRWAEVYQMHVAYVSAETNERRKQKMEDVKKRSEYRKAHGLEDDGKLGGWTFRSGPETSETGLKEGEVDMSKSAPESTAELVQGTTENVTGQQSGEETYVDFEGNKQTLRKKWFGIW